MKSFTGVAWSIALTALLLAGVLAAAQKTKSNDTKNASGSGANAKSDVALDATSKDAAKMSNAQSNPMYKEQKSEGTNPLYEKPDSTLKAQDPSATGSQNGTAGVNACYRPGNNKTSKASSTPNGNHKDVEEYKDGEDGTIHTWPASQK